MTVVLLMLLGCRGAPPPGLVQELRVIHEVAPLDELRERYPGLVHHLGALARDPEAGPLVRDRAWVLLAASPERQAGAWAAAAVSDPEVPVSTRYKVLRRLADAHPEAALRALPAASCHDARLIRRGAQAAREALLTHGHPVPPTPCDG